MPLRRNSSARRFSTSPPIANSPPAPSASAVAPCNTSSRNTACSRSPKIPAMRLEETDCLTPKSVPELPCHVGHRPSLRWISCHSNGSANVLLRANRALRRPLFLVPEFERFHCETTGPNVPCADGSVGVGPSQITVNTVFLLSD